MASLFRQWSEFQRELAELEKSEQEKLRLADLWSFQRKEIEAAALKPGEDAELENERLVLKNVARLAGERERRLFRAVRLARERIRASADGHEEAGRSVPYRCAAWRPSLETLKSAAIGVDEASYRNSRLSGPAGGRSGSFGRHRVAPGADRSTEAQVRIEPGRGAGVSRECSRADCGRRRRRANAKRSWSWSWRSRARHIATRPRRSPNRARPRPRSYAKSGKRTGRRWRWKTRFFGLESSPRTGPSTAPIEWSF